MSVTPRTSSVISDGDFLVVYESHLVQKPLQVRAHSIFNNRFGAFDHSAFIGRRYGSRVYNRDRDAYVIPLRVTPELWSNALLHRTQIMYVADRSLLQLMCNIQPGSIVYESGTGSGSMTVTLANAVRPTGHVHTFEYHKERVAAAAIDFQRLKLSRYITVRHRDVVSAGFPRMTDSTQHTLGVDAVILDIPSPWNVIESCARVLAPGTGRIASYSPCIEQTQRTCLALAAHQFTDIRTVEVLIHNYEVQKQHWPLPNFHAAEQASQADDKQPSPESKETEEVADMLSGDDASDDQPRKKLKTDANVDSSQANGKAAEHAKSQKQQRPKKAKQAQLNTAGHSMLTTSHPYHMQRGHTAFLTSATNGGGNG